jgi:hypothetical protein
MSAVEPVALITEATDQTQGERISQQLRFLKVKQSNNTPMEAQGKEGVQFLLIHSLGTRWM